jgi:hypothetical protein
MTTIQFILRKAALLLWLVFGLAFNGIEARVFHTDTWIGLTIGMILGGYLGYIVNRPKTAS